VKEMRTFRSVVQSLVKLPRGFTADGRPIGLGLDAALQAQRARGGDADIRPIRVPSEAPVEEQRYSRAS
jgi:hypothetical protein